MKKTQRKDTVRNISREKISYISIAVISLLAICSFLGINYGAKALRDSANRFYDAHNYRDLELGSTMLLGDDDIEELISLENIDRAEKVYQISGKVKDGDGYKDVDIVSVTERINTLTMVEGRLPENENECVIEKELAETMNLSIGDKISISDSFGKKSLYLLSDEFSVTGVALHGDHYARSVQAPGNRYVLVNKEAFDREYLVESFMKAVIKIKDTDGLSRFGRPYKKRVNEVRNQIESWSQSREKRREYYFKKLLDEKFAEAQQKLDEGRSQLDEAKSELDENEKKIADGEKKIGEGEELIAEKEEEVKKGEEEIKEGEEKLKEAKKELDSAKIELDAGKKELDAAEDEINKAKEKLDAALEELNKAADKLDDYAKELGEAEVSLISSYNEAESEKARLRDAVRTEIEDSMGSDVASEIDWATEEPIGELGDPTLTVMKFKITNGKSIDLSGDIEGGVISEIDEIASTYGYEEEADVLKDKIKSNSTYSSILTRLESKKTDLNKWDENYAAYLKGKAEYDENLKKYNTSLEEYNGKKTEFEQNFAKFEEKRLEYEEAEVLYNQGKDEYEQSKKDLEEGRKKLIEGKDTIVEKQAEIEQAKKDVDAGKEKVESGKKEYEEGVDEYEKGVESYEDAKARIVVPDTCHFVLFDNRSNASFTHADDSAKNVARLGMTFAMLFALLGALVIYVTVGRIIDEQRTLVGTQKALGFFSNEVFRKYLTFGISATLIGIAAGIAAGYLFIEKIITNAHEQFYMVGRIKRGFLPGMTAGAAIAGIVVAALSVYWACSKLLRETARQLMLPSVPNSINKTQTRQKKGSLYSRLILRNMISEWPRVLITIISIAGACVLMVIGFSLKNGVKKAMDRQFKYLIEYTDTVKFDSAISDTAEYEIDEILSREGIMHTEISSAYRTFDSPEGLTAGELICIDKEDLKYYLKFFSADEMKNTDLPDRGVAITRRLSEAYNLDKGDVFTIYDEGMDPHDVTVTEVFDYYFGKNMFMSKSAYKETFGNDSKANAFLVKTDIGKEKLEELVSHVKGFQSTVSTKHTEKTYRDMTKVITVVTLTLIVAAALMGYFVLMNLINMYLNKKKRELTIMRVNGFTTKEVIRYVAGESVVTTVLGIILGLFAGSGFAYLIARLIEQPQFGLIRSTDYSAWLISAALTAVFAFVINKIALRKVKTLKLSDIA